MCVCFVFEFSMDHYRRRVEIINKTNLYLNNYETEMKTNGLSLLIYRTASISTYIHNIIRVGGTHVNIIRYNIILYDHGVYTLSR